MLTNTSKRNIFALAVVLLCGNAVTAATVNMNNICLLLTENALIASGDSCSSYYSCSNGVATPKTCSPGFYFDKNSQACVNQAPSYCSSSNADPCVGRPVGSFVAVSGSCSGYYYCSAKGAQRSNCPNNLVFNPTTQSCAYSSTYACDDSTNANTVNTNVINLCSLVQNGVYIANAFSCPTWQKCISDNSFITGTCSEGLVFDRINVLCNYPSAVQCSQLTYDPSLDVTSAASGGTCSTNGLIKKATSCNQYYLCNGLTWVLKNCIGNLYYDTNSGQCVNRLNAINDCDRCASTNDAFVNTFGTNCTGYSYCSHGVQQSSGSCSSGLFFNEELQGCTDQNPEFIFCAAASATSTTDQTPTDASTQAATSATSSSEAGTAKPPTEAETTKAPAAEAAAPTENPAAPTENPAAPTENPAAPTAETAAPTAETAAPAAEPSTG